MNRYKVAHKSVEAKEHYEKLQIIRLAHKYLDSDIAMLMDIEPDRVKYIREKLGINRRKVCPGHFKRIADRRKGEL